MEKTLQLAMENKDYIVEMRRHFHCNPEPSEHEVNTSKRIYEELEKMGLEPKMVCSSGTGVMCDIKGKGPGEMALGIAVTVLVSMLEPRCWVRVSQIV